MNVRSKSKPHAMMSRAWVGRDRQKEVGFGHFESLYLGTVLLTSADTFTVPCSAHGSLREFLGPGDGRPRHVEVTLNTIASHPASGVAGKTSMLWCCERKNWVSLEHHDVAMAAKRTDGKRLANP